MSGTFGDVAATGSGSSTQTAAVGSTFEGQSAFKQTEAFAVVITGGGVTTPFSAVGD